MKKLFVLTFVLVMLLTGCTTRTNHTTPDIVSETPTSNEEHFTQDDDGKITIDFLKSIQSWKELASQVVPISDDAYEHINNYEDLYCLQLIQEISKPMTAPLYHNADFIELHLDYIELKYVDFSRLITKYDLIINLYNKDNELYLKWGIISHSKDYARLDVYSTNLEYLDNPVTQIGQTATIQVNSNYWSDCQNYGSGKKNTVFPLDNQVIVKGVAYLDEKGNVVSRNFEENAEIHYGEEHMIYVSFTDGSESGWVFPTNLKINK